MVFAMPTDTTERIAFVTLRAALNAALQPPVLIGQFDSGDLALIGSIFADRWMALMPA